VPGAPISRTPLGTTPPQTRVLGGILEKIHDFDQFSFGFFNTRRVGEGHTRLTYSRLVVAPGLAFAETKDSTAHLSGGFSGEPQETANQQQRGTEAKQNGHEWIRG
jgi:hypothetical protein